GACPRVQPLRARRSLHHRRAPLPLPSLRAPRPATRRVCSPPCDTADPRCGCLHPAARDRSTCASTYVTSQLGYPRAVPPRQRRKLRAHRPELRPMWRECEPVVLKSVRAGCPELVLGVARSAAAIAQHDPKSHALAATRRAPAVFARTLEVGRP